MQTIRRQALSEQASKQADRLYGKISNRTNLLLRHTAFNNCSFPSTILNLLFEERPVFRPDEKPLSTHVCTSINRDFGSSENYEQRERTY